jgi:hypothetical protein
VGNIKTPRPLSAIIVALAALVAALAGTAIAGPGATTSALTKSKVKKIATRQINKLAPGLSVDHANTADSASSASPSGPAGGDLTENYPNPLIGNQVVSTAKIADQAVNTPKLNVIQFDRAIAEVANPGSAGQVGFADDPSITLDGQPGDLILLHARVDIRRDAGTGRCNVLILFEPPAAEPSTTQRFAASESAAFETVYMDPFEASGVVSGTTSALAAEAREIPVVQPGQYSFTFRYDQGNASTDCSFRDRALWAGILR